MIERVESAEFASEAFWAKSKVFVGRALEMRDNGDGATFSVWAGAALELLAKAFLASIHPALVADPQKFHSLLAACGIRRSDDLRTIMASTSFERIRDIDKRFDKKHVDSAKLISERRNAELHSGTTAPTEADDKWVATYWEVVATILQIYDRALHDWIGQEEAARVTDLLADRTKLRAGHVRARIDRRRAEFSLRFPPSSPARVAIEASAKVSPPPGYLTHSADDVERHVCPACGVEGWLVGSEWEESVVEPGERAWDPQTGETWFQEEVVEVLFAVDAYVCPYCELHLEGGDEIEAASLPTEFSRFRSREPQDEPDYGND